MQVKRNFELLYRNESDPWKIGNADSERYNLYFDLIMQDARSRRKILDVGCGFGAFLSRFQGKFEQLAGIELSAEAITKAKARFPFIQFVQGSAEQLSDLLPGNDQHDVIVCSDVIYYLNESGKNKLLESMAQHLSPSGIAFIAAWCPGGKYLEFDELQRLVKKYFVVEHEQFLESQHAVFLGRAKKTFIAVTIDYETWHPIPPGKTINWENDVFIPTEKLLRLCSDEGVKLTIMAEMGEYFWLKQFQPQTAKKMEEQWQDAIRGRHDVQLHLHPCWLPELGARQENGNWYWDWSKAKADDYPGDLVALIARCKSALETTLQPVNQSYRVNSFRAGAYQVQPFVRLYEALTKNGIFCDSSVYAGGVSSERGYDYRLAHTDHQPYRANRIDPQLLAPPDEQGIVEIPVFTWKPDGRWFLDNDEGKKFAGRLLKYLSDREQRWKSSEIFRLKKKWKRLTSSFLKSSMHDVSTDSQDEFFVMIGHSKSNLQFDAIRENFRRLKREKRFEFVTLAHMALTARSAATSSSTGRKQHSSNSFQGQGASRYLLEFIPLDRSNILDLQFADSAPPTSIDSFLPWAKVTNAHLEGSSLGNGSFDCVRSDMSLEQVRNADRTLKEIHDALRIGGVFVATLPSYARNPQKNGEHPHWNTVPHEVRWRLRDVGFADVVVEEHDVVREFGMPPYPPSDDKIMFIRAWKRPEGYRQLDRATEAMQWVHARLNPERSSEGSDARKILSGGYAFCWGYVVSLGEILRREGFSVRWLTMLAKDHPRGRGTEKIDSHEVLLVQLDGKELILDAMANTIIPYAFTDVLKQPGLSKPKQNPDDRYQQRGYQLYDTEFWYSRVVKYAIRDDPKEKIFFWKRVK